MIKSGRFWATSKSIRCVSFLPFRPKNFRFFDLPFLPNISPTPPISYLD